ncbi:MAG: uracil-DNA glycosylase family protein, partial [Candidatus Hodarchaeota archaeon]
FHGNLLILMQAPGRQEDQFGFPAVGQAGQYMDEKLDFVGITYMMYLVANTVLCYPGRDENTGRDNPPKAKEIKKCRHHFETIIKYMPNLQYILTFGSVALKALIPTKIKMADIIGGVYDKFMGIPIFPLYHPSYVMGNQNTPIEASFMDGLNTLKTLLDGKQRKDEIETYVLLEEGQIKRTLEFLINFKGRIACDLETTSKRPKIAKILGLSFAVNNHQGVYIPFRVKKDDNIVELFPNLRPIWIKAFQALSDNQTIIIGQNFNYDRTVLLNDLGVEFKNIESDIMLKDSLVASYEKSHELESMIPRWLTTIDRYKASFRNLIGAGSYDDGSFANVPVKLLGEYAAKDAVYTFKIDDVVSERMENYDQIDLWN